MQYRLDELEKLSDELGLDSQRVNASRLDVVFNEECVLAFCNLLGEEGSLVGFEGTPWHAHDLVQFSTGASHSIELDELEILIGLAIGELLIVTEYSRGQLRDRWISHKDDPLEFRDLDQGDEVRILCLAPRE